MDEATIIRDIRKFIGENYMAGAQESLKDSDSFLKNGIIDSIGVIELVAFLQDKYSIRVETKEIVPENFDTVRNLVGYLRKKIDKKTR